jgi:hypothetical protein
MAAMCAAAVGCMAGARGAACVNAVLSAGGGALMDRGSHIIVTRHHQLHAAGAGTDEVHAVWVDDRGCHGHAHRQNKPHQHKAGELDGVAQALHAFDYVVSHRQTLVC